MALRLNFGKANGIPFSCQHVTCQTRDPPSDPPAPRRRCRSDQRCAQLSAAAVSKSGCQACESSPFLGTPGTLIPAAYLQLLSQHNALTNTSHSREYSSASVHCEKFRVHNSREQENNWKQFGINKLPWCVQDYGLDKYLSRIYGNLVGL